jgi:hypothetical protein
VKIVLSFNEVFGQTDGGSGSVEQTGNFNKSTRVPIPDQTGAATFVQKEDFQVWNRPAAAP